MLSQSGNSTNNFRLFVGKMSKLQSLKLFVQQRLSAAVQDILGHLEETIRDYEEELGRRRPDLLDVVLTPEVEQREPDVQQLLVSKEEPPHIKEEQEELWSSEEGEQLQGLEEADDNKFPFTAAPVKSEDDEEKPQSSQLHQSQTEDSRETEPLSSSSAHHMETGADRGPQTDSNSHPYTQLGPDTGVKGSNCSDISEDEGKDTKEPQQGLFPERHDKCNAAKKSFVCCECGRKFGRKDSLRRHMRYHTGERPYCCSVCGKRFSQRPNLIRHMRCHSGEKPFSCSFCDTSFAVRSALVNHLRIHTGEKPFSCSHCDKSFTQKGGLKKHMTVHTGERPYSCPICAKSFSQKANLTYHFSVHTGQKQFSCNICHKRFTWQSQVKSHKCKAASAAKFH